MLKYHILVSIYYIQHKDRHVLCGPYVRELSLQHKPRTKSRPAGARGRLGSSSLYLAVLGCC